MGFGDFINGPKYRKESERLQAELNTQAKDFEHLRAIAQKTGAMELVEVQKLISGVREGLEKLTLARQEKEKELDGLKQQIGLLRGQVLVLEEDLLLESFALYKPKFSFTSSAEYKSRLELVRSRQKEMIKSGMAATGNENWTVNNSASEGKKLVKDMIKLVVRSFNNEADYCVDNVKFNNIELGEKRIQQSFDALNKLGRIMSVRISEQYRSLKLEELHLAHEYQVKKQAEKEEQRKLREELREQQKLEQEIRAAREKIAKERRHFEGALKDLNRRIQEARDPAELLVLQQRMAEVNAQFEALDSEEKAIDYRESNAKAGYVYVISNIGAFGEGIFKIGMTRRLEPLERIDELGDASVPFCFDVHALVFSENAPHLEAKLHERFQGTRLNKINARKEFFRANIDEIEAVIRANYDSAVEIIRDAAAEQFRESLKLGC